MVKTPNGGGLGSIPGQRNSSHMPQRRLKVLHAATKIQCSQINIKKKIGREICPLGPRNSRNVSNRYACMLGNQHMLYSCTIVPKNQESGKPYKRCKEYHAAVKRTRKDLQTNPESLQDPMANGQRQGVECWMSDYTICVESGGIRIYFPGQFPGCPVIRTPPSQCRFHPRSGN